MEIGHLQSADNGLDIPAVHTKKTGWDRGSSTVPGRWFLDTKVQNTQYTITIDSHIIVLSYSSPSSLISRLANEADWTS